VTLTTDARDHFLCNYDGYSLWRGCKDLAPLKTRKSNVAVIGIGKQGGKLANAAVEAGFNLVAVCDSNPNQLRNFRLENESTRFERIASAEQLEDLPIDLCILATLAESHLPLIRLLYQIGIRNIFCEKPVVNQFADLVTLQSFIAETGLRLLVNHTKLWSADFEFAKSISQSGSLGKLQRASLRFKPSGFGNIGSHQLAALVYITGMSLAGVSSAAFEETTSFSRGQGYNDPNGVVQFDLAGVPVDADNRSMPVGRRSRLTFYFEAGVLELLEDSQLIRFLDFSLGTDVQARFRDPWLGSRKSSHLLNKALSELTSTSNTGKLEAAFQAVEGIIAAQVSFLERKSTSLDLSPATKTPFPFS
jgi:predicted dehydrogenase